MGKCGVIFMFFCMCIPCDVNVTIVDLYLVVECGTAYMRYAGMVGVLSTFDCLMTGRGSNVQSSLLILDE